jgi:hypothetical protein
MVSCQMLRYSLALHLLVVRDVVLAVTRNVGSDRMEQGIVPVENCRKHPKVPWGE